MRYRGRFLGLKSDKVEYLKTFFITLLCIIVVISVVVFDAGYGTRSKVSEIMKSKLDFDEKEMELEELYELEKANPYDYTINLKIAALHEQLNEPDKARENYEKAIEKSPRTPLVAYRVALFYITQKQYKEAVALIEAVPELTNNKILGMKMRFYTALSNALEEDGSVLPALDTAKLASKYAKGISKEEYLSAQKNLAGKYILAADYYVEKKEPEEAILALKTTLKLDPASNLAKYKLALIYKDAKPEQAARLINEVLGTEDTTLVNLELYYELLSSLREKAIKASNPHLADFYLQKERSLKKFATRNYIFKDEFSAQDAKLVIRNSMFFETKYLAFQIVNNSKSLANRLFVKAQVQEPGENPRVFTRRLAALEPSYGLDKGVRELVFLFDKAPILDKKPLKEGMRIEIFVRKNDKFDWTLLYEGPLKMPSASQSPAKTKAK